MSEYEGSEERIRFRIPVLALTALLAVGLIGGWLIAAPFVTGIQPRGERWLTATRDDVACGGALVGLAIVGLLGYLAASTRWLAAYGRRVSSE